jgi:ABC-type transport system involved in multi-copper enzyme maturation permease subunit
MLRRELAIVLGAPVTWLTAAAAALLVGHGFVLAVDLFTAGSRSALASALMSREFDPLLGIVRPTLGGLYLAVSLFGPLIGARAVAIEKDRRTFAGQLLASGSAGRFLAGKGLAALVGACLPWLCAIALFLLWRGVGGHLAVGETSLALLGHLLYAAFVTAVGLAAGALARGFAQAATAALLAIAFTWGVDAAVGFSALAWLGGAAAWSPTTHLRPFEQGTLDLGAAGWLVGATVGALAFAYAGCRFDWHGRRRAGALAAALVLFVVAAAGLRSSRRAWDLSERKRHSLPPAAAAELRRLPAPIRIVVNLDREDSRRRQLESDTLAKLRLARPDVEVRFPPDERASPAELERDDGYGRIVISLGDRSKETTSTSRRELTSLIFELAGRSLPDWSAPEYSGYPLVVEGGRRSLVLAASYAALPVTFIVLGFVLTTGRRRPT